MRDMKILFSILIASLFLIVSCNNRKSVEKESVTVSSPIKQKDSSFYSCFGMYSEGSEISIYRENGNISLMKVIGFGALGKVVVFYKIDKNKIKSIFFKEMLFKDEFYDKNYYINDSTFKNSTSDTVLIKQYHIIQDCMSNINCGNIDCEEIK